MRLRHLLVFVFLTVPVWLVLLFYCLMHLGYAWDFARWKIGQPAWMWPGSVLLCTAFLLTNAAAFARSPGARFPIALAAALLGNVFLWKSAGSFLGELIYGFSFFGVALSLLYFSIRWLFDRDDSFAK